MAPEEHPMEKILGPDLSRFVRAIHEQHGVIPHLGETARGLEGKRMTLSGGSVLEADLVVAGLGVRPRLSLAEEAGLKIDRGIVVDAFLERARQESSPPATSRVGRTASPVRLYASNIGSSRSGKDRPRRSTCSARRGQFDAVPFFWSQHYDVPINYVGHAESWDDLVVEGDIANKDGLVRIRRAGRTLAVASIFRDLESLEAEVGLEQEAAQTNS